MRGNQVQKALKSELKDEPIEIAPDIWWIGTFEEHLQCNSYLIKGSSFHTIIDSGSRPQFPKILMKILKIGIAPQSIGALTYSHIDPDVCGNIVDFVDLINSPTLRIISDENNLPFIAHYAPDAKLMSTQSLNHNIVLDNVKRIQFYNTPHCHNQGSIISFEESTATLFTSDILGNYKISRESFLSPKYDHELTGATDDIEINEDNADIIHLIKFHRDVFPSTPALHYAFDIIERIPFAKIAPQHGAILMNRIIAEKAIRKIRNSGEIGIERILNPKHHVKYTKGMRFP